MRFRRRRSERSEHHERGAVAVMVGVSATLLASMAAFTVDMGVHFSERRQAQSAVDAGVLAGTQDADLGLVTISTTIEQTVRSNLTQTFTDAEWYAMWASCSDADSYVIKGTVNGSTTDCISFDPSGKVRVRQPDLEVDTVFGGLVGVDTIKVAANAEARLGLPGGVLPFAVLAGSGSGELCLQTASGGQAVGPCAGPASGNFGTLEVNIYGSFEHGTASLNCGNVNTGDMLLINVSVGADHTLLPWTGASNIVDSCSKPWGPNRLGTASGNNSADIMEGMIDGGQISGNTFDGLLTKTTNATVEIQHGGANINQIDNRPLWEYIPYNKAAAIPGVPVICEREEIEATLLATDIETATQQMMDCLALYEAAAPGTYSLLFDLDVDGTYGADILATPRFGYVPQMVETSWPTGTSDTLRIDTFKAVYIHSLWFNCTGTSCADIVIPGTPVSTWNVGGGSGVLDQVSGIIIPKGMLPQELEGDGGILDPYAPELID